MRKDMAIYGQQTSLFTEDIAISSQEGFRVKTQVLRNKTVENRDLTAKELDFGGTWQEQLTKSDRDMWLPKTWQTFLKLTEGETSERFSPNWPEWGTMQNGEFAERAKKVRRITAQGCIWLLTPTASEYKRDKLSYPMLQKRHHRSAGGLTEHLYRLFGPVSGRLNPRFLLWMMGFPENWLENKSKPPETP